MATRKSPHRWETRRHRALSSDAQQGGVSGPQERLVLQFADGRQGSAQLSLHMQQVDGWALSDPDLLHAISCWLVARGGRWLHCTDDRGHIVADGPIRVADLGVGGPGPTGRLISLAPSNAELIDALGQIDRVIAVEDSSDFPPDLAGRERLGPDLAPDLDQVSRLQPHLVLSSLSVPGMEAIVTGLRARGVPQLVLAPRSVDDVCDDLRRVGRALGVEDRAESACADLERQRSLLRARRAATPMRVYLEWWPRPMFTPGAACFSNELIGLAGGVNVFGGRPGASLEISTQELLDADPDICFVSWCGVRESKLDIGHLLRRPGLEVLRAARLRRVYALDEAFAGRPGPRMLEAARRMAAAISAG